MGARLATVARAAAAVLPLLAGCTTTDGTGNSVRQLDGAYEAPRSASLPPDIKQILAAGGLDVVNPSAPTRETEVTEMASNTSSDVKKPEHTMAGPPTPSPDHAAQAMALVAAAPAPATQSMAAAPEPKAESVTFVYPDIGVKASHQSVDHAMESSAAKAPRPERKRMHAAVEPKPAADTAGSPIKKPKRF